jgi:nitroimidazol reductase NimA-like FMN-containing flavoprotein (pyridoxamine 5'-phosphate oxidase superfamily)
MHETADDLARLQALLDRSYESAGRHLREVITPERRLSAADLAARLQGMRLLVLATVTRDGRPMAGPVDGIFYRGAWYFGSAPDSLRIAHIRHNPAVSATHLPSEELSVTAHGRATVIDIRARGQIGFRRALLDIYVPRYGPDWETFLDSGPVYARIEAARLFTFFMPAADALGSPD